MYADNSVLKHKKKNLDTYYTSCYRHWIDAFSEAYGKLNAIYEEVGGIGASALFGWLIRCTAPLTKAVNGFWSITPIRRIPVKGSRCPPKDTRLFKQGWPPRSKGEDNSA